MYYFVAIYLILQVFLGNNFSYRVLFHDIDFFIVSARM